MTIPADQVQAQLDAWEARACTNKKPFGERGARDVASRMREQGAGNVVPYACPFCHRHHVGHALGIESLTTIAVLMRARSGNAPGVPGTGTTRRQRRARRQATR